MVKWLDWVMHIVGAHEEPHPGGVPENYAHDKLTIVTAEALASPRDPNHRLELEHRH
jgi:hypothetical protein